MAIFYCFRRLLGDYRRGCQELKARMSNVDNLSGKLQRSRRRGSRPRCHWLTHRTPEQVSRRLTAMAEPWGSVFPGDHWIPEGFDRIDEVQLHEAPRLLPVQDCKFMGDW